MAWATTEGELGVSTIPPFLRKLWDLVNDPSTDHVATWAPGGRSILFEVELMKEVLPRFFKHSNWSSFVRQINMYGFKKLGMDKGRWEFANPNFTQFTSKEALKVIHRRVKPAAAAAHHHGQLMPAQPQLLPDQMDQVYPCQDLPMGYVEPSQGLRAADLGHKSRAMPAGMPFGMGCLPLVPAVDPCGTPYFDMGGQQAPGPAAPAVQPLPAATAVSGLPPCRAVSTSSLTALAASGESNIVGLTAGLPAHMHLNRHNHPFGREQQGSASGEHLSGSGSSGGGVAEVTDGARAGCRQTKRGRGLLYPDNQGTAATTHTSQCRDCEDGMSGLQYHQQGAEQVLHGPSAVGRCHPQIESLNASLPRLVTDMADQLDKLTQLAGEVGGHLGVSSQLQQQQAMPALGGKESLSGDLPDLASIQAMLAEQKDRMGQFKMKTVEAEMQIEAQREAQAAQWYRNAALELRLAQQGKLSIDTAEVTRMVAARHEHLTMQLARQEERNQMQMLSNRVLEARVADLERKLKGATELREDVVKGLEDRLLAAVGSRLAASGAPSLSTGHSGSIGATNSDACDFPSGSSPSSEAGAVLVSVPTPACLSPARAAH